jgi:hypothetical protein
MLRRNGKESCARTGPELVARLPSVWRNRSPLVHSSYFRECSNARNWLSSAQNWCDPKFPHAIAGVHGFIATDFFDGAARLSQGKKVVESRLLAMLRMLLASALRWIIPGLETNSISTRSHAW